MRKLIVISLMLLFIIPLFADSYKYGKISNEELEMTEIPEDPEANVVILIDKIIIKFSQNFDILMEYHKRVKILTEEGKDYANIEIPYYHKDRIYHLDARSVSVSGEETELDDDNIYEGESGNMKVKKFAIPGVEVGSVLEYRYKISSGYWHIPIWYFQGKEFTKKSEMSVYLPYQFTFSVLEMNTSFYDIKKESVQTFNPSNLKEKCALHTWSGSNIPGIKKEPYMYKFSDYYAQVLFQIVEFKSLYTRKKYASSWDDIAARYWKEMDDFVNQDKGLSEIAINLTQNTTTNLEKTTLIYNMIARNIRTTDNTGFWGDDFKKPKDVYETKEGSVNEKNILLINMLKHIGIDSKPLIISKKNNGRIISGWATLQQFNRVIVQAKIDGKKYFLNTESKFCPMGYLTPLYDVEEGLLINEKKGSIVSIKPLKPKNRIEISTEAHLDLDGNLNAVSKFKYKDLNAVQERDRLEDKDIKEYLEDKLEDLHPDAVLDQFQYVAKDSFDVPLELKLTYHIPDFAEIAGNISYFTMPLFQSINDNPFVREKRSFPVEFRKENTISEKCKIYIPEDKRISEKPEKMRASMKKLTFNKIYFSNETSIECRRTYNLKRCVFHTDEYPELKKVYEKIVNSDLDQIVLEQIN